MTDVRAARLQDEEAALDLLEQLFEPPGERPPDYSRARAGFHAAIEGDRSAVLLALEGGMTVGLASVYVDIESMRFGRRCWLEDLVVSRDRRGRGIGALLIEAATRWARERGCSHLELDSGLGRVDAHRSYEANAMPKTSYTFAKRLS